MLILTRDNKLRFCATVYEPEVTSVRFELRDSSGNTVFTETPRAVDNTPVYCIERDPPAPGTYVLVIQGLSTTSGGREQVLMTLYEPIIVLDTTQDPYHARFDEIKGELDSVKAQLDRIESTDLAGIKSELDSVRAQLDSIKSELDSIKTELAAIEKWVKYRAA